MWQQGWSAGDIIAVDSGIVLATLVLSPDMDLFDSRPTAGWGVLRFFWWPYARLVKHRDHLHTPVLGTAVRWLYTLAILSILGTLVWVLLDRAGVNLHFSFEGDLVYNLLYVLDVFIGASIADALHFVLDMVTHGLKHGEPHHHHQREEEQAF
jgi:uncharacterized metal-binding protein